MAGKLLSGLRKIGRSARKISFTSKTQKRMLRSAYKDLRRGRGQGRAKGIRFDRTTAKRATKRVGNIVGGTQAAIVGGAGYAGYRSVRGRRKKRR